MALVIAFCSEEGTLTKRIISSLIKNPEFSPYWEAANRTQKENFVNALFAITTSPSQKQIDKRKVPSSAKKSQPTANTNKKKLSAAKKKRKPAVTKKKTVPVTKKQKKT